MPLCINVLVDNTVDECLPHGIVGRCLFLTHSVFHHEGARQRLYQPVIYPYIELIKVGFPQTVRIDTVCPPYIRIVGRNFFPIVHKIHRVARVIGNTVVFSEHQNTGQRESLFSGFIFCSVCTYFFQEIHVVDTHPRMGGLQAGKCLSILMQRFYIYIPFKVKAHKDAPVLRMAVMFSIRKHSSYLRIGTEIISLMVSPVSISERIGTDIHRAQFITCTRNIAYQNI